MTQPSLLIETWAEKAERLARERKAAEFDPFTSSKKQREAYFHARYALWCHLRDVP